jgi:3-oxoacyl-[acyl-carrier protein] reductase
MCLKGKTVMITGASGGIGRELSVRLAKMGANLILFGGKNLEKLNKTAELVKEFGVKVKTVGGDITDEKFIEDNFLASVNEFDSLDVLINNAGLSFNANVENTPLETFDKIMNINVRAPFMLIQKALPLLQESNRASIINIASVVAHNGYPYQSAYTASKHALLGLTKSLASEVYRDGIRVHAISPGGVFTDMIKVSRPDLTDEGMILPSEIADIVEFLLKNRGNAVIDEIIVHRIGKEPFLA